jgi:hypothetical protein
MLKGLDVENIEQSFSRLYDLAPPPPPPPRSPVSKLYTASHRKTEKEGQLADGRGRGKREGGEPNHTTGETLVLYKSFNTLFTYVYQE